MSVDTAVAVQEITNAVSENTVENIAKERKKKKKANNVKGGPPKDPLTSDYLPYYSAQGSAHYGRTSLSSGWSEAPGKRGLTSEGILFQTPVH
ncbi:MAG: hypothetical protein H0W50_04565 [Parachlamydiaceae bacterium]|nr:hypothetical protein [Parachlamydiaceae bacterium]